jgi:putative membrane protein
MKKIFYVFTLAMAYCLFAFNAFAAAPTDPQIAHIVVTANQIDIDAGNLAMKKTQSAEVKEFANRMVTDHTGVNKQASDLVTKLKVTPEDNETSKSLMTGAASNMKKLNSMKGTAFDKEYIDHEVTYHRAVLKTIDDTLIPNAKNTELKDLITKVRPAIAAHLEHAVRLQNKMK